MKYYKVMVPRKARLLGTTVYFAMEHTKWSDAVNLCHELGWNVNAVDIDKVSRFEYAAALLLYPVTDYKDCLNHDKAVVLW